jgi:collagen type I/II/III/V/XI/XXIV/XXVII alpha
MAGANSRFKVDNGLVASGNAIFYDRVDMQANAFFNNDLFVVSGNLTVNGTLIFANVVIGNGGVIPISDQQPLGNTTNRFNAFLYDTTSFGTLRPNANGGALGTTTERFQVFANNITVTNTVNFPSGAAVNSSLYTGTASNANTVYNISANGIVVRTGTGTGTTVSIASANGISITNGDGVSGNPSVAFVANAGLTANAGGVWVDASAITVGTLPTSRGGTGGSINNLLPAQSAGTTGYVLASSGATQTLSWSQLSGPQGPQGATGVQGAQGATGAQGPQGTIGAQGVASTVPGPQGITGAQGVQGITGPQGAQGPSVQGPQGPQGAQGIQGPQGPQGLTGPQGAASSVAGPQGSAGAQGATGPQGPQGVTGAQGAASSVAGPQGSAGPQGPQGSQGSAAGAAAPILRHVTAGFTSGGQVFVTASTPTASAAGDIWIDTAGTTGYTQSLTANGWTRLPNGVILQWGTVSAAANQNNSGTFPTSFTSVARAVMNGVGDTGEFGAASKGPTIYAVSTSGFSYHNGDQSTATGFWLAMGY